LEVQELEDFGLAVDMDLNSSAENSPMAVRRTFLGRVRQSSVVSNCSMTSVVPLELELGLTLELDLDDGLEDSGHSPTPLALFNVQPTGCSSPTVSGLAPHSPAAVPLDISVGSGGDVKVKLVSPNRCGGGRERQSVVMRSPLKTPLRFSHRRKNSGVMYPSSPGNGGQLNLRQRSASAVEIRSPRSPLALQMLQYDDQHVLVLENSQMKHIARSLNVSMDQVASVYAGLKSAPRREGGDVPDLALPTTRNGEARSHAVRNLRAELIDME
jgi:hypothetical protein